MALVKMAATTSGFCRRYLAFRYIADVGQCLQNHTQVKDRHKYGAIGWYRVAVSYCSRVFHSGLVAAILNFGNQITSDNVGLVQMGG